MGADTPRVCPSFRHRLGQKAGKGTQGTQVHTCLCLLFAFRMRAEGALLCPLHNFEQSAEPSVLRETGVAWRGGSAVGTRIPVVARSVNGKRMPHRLPRGAPLTASPQHVRTISRVPPCRGAAQSR